MTRGGPGAAEACDACLRRTDLIAAMAAWLDVEWRRRSAPAGVLSLPDEALLALDRSGEAARRYAGFSARAARERIRAAGLVAVCSCRAAYPERLRALADPPAVLHVAGRLPALESEPSVAIVGARRGTSYGLEVARALGRGVTAAGLPVVSGLAMGIDSASHVGAFDAEPPPLVPPGVHATPTGVDAGDAPPAPPAAELGIDGRKAGWPPDPAWPAAPVAVLAGGADLPYPASRRRLHARIAACGAVVSELPPGFTAYRWCFVARNRIIAALGAVCVVVEAAERSGSLTTADFAEQIGRPVAAVPGPVTSRFSGGTNALLAAGAAVVRDPRDVLDLLLGPDAPAPGPPPPPAVPIEPRLRGLLDAIERGHGSLAELVGGADAAHRVLEDLTDLELRGLVRRDFGGRYVRALETGR